MISQYRAILRIAALWRGMRRGALALLRAAFTPFF
jgi:hypothetical protein